MNEIIKKYPNRVVDCTTYYLVMINRSNNMIYKKDIDQLEFYIDDDNFKKHLKDMFSLTFNWNPHEFIEWICKEYNLEDDIEGFNDSDSDSDGDDSNNDSDEETNKDYLYDELTKKINPDRKLKIYSYGKKHRRKPPPDCQCTFNACILSGKRSGLNLKKMNGLDLEVQKSVETSKNYDIFFL